MGRREVMGMSPRRLLGLLAVDQRRRRRRHGGGSASLLASPTTYASDSFNRADGAIGTADVGGAWTDPAGFWTVNSNSAKLSAASGFRICYLDDGHEDGAFRLTMTVSGTCGLMMRRNGADNSFIGTRVTSGLLRLTRLTAGVLTTIASGGAVVDGDEVKVVVSGISWEVFLNDVSQFTATESQGSASTQHGMQSQFTAGRNDDYSHRSA
jgi:hypothetical protein